MSKSHPVVSFPFYRFHFIFFLSSWLVNCGLQQHTATEHVEWMRNLSEFSVYEKLKPEELQKYYGSPHSSFPVFAPHRTAAPWNTAQDPHTPPPSEQVEMWRVKKVSNFIRCLLCAHTGKPFSTFSPSPSSSPSIWKMPPDRVNKGK